MNTICISSTVWNAYSDKSRNLVVRFIDGTSDSAGSLNIDFPTIEREPDAELVVHEFLIQEIDFRSWVQKVLNEGGLINNDAIRRQAQTFSKNSIVIVNASGFDVDIINRAFAQLRLGIYSLINWPRAIVIVCDDTQSLQVGSMLSRAFYIRPLIQVKTLTSRQVKTMMREALLLRLFGWNAKSFSQYFRKYFAKAFARSDKKEVKKLGMVWEE